MDNLIVKGFDNETVRFISTMVAIFSILYFLGLRFQLAHDSVNWKNQGRLVPFWRFFVSFGFNFFRFFNRFKKCL